MRLSPFQRVQQLSALTVFLFALGGLAPAAGAGPPAPDVATPHASLLTVSPSHPQAGELVTFEVQDSLAKRQIIADVRWRFPDGSSVSGPSQRRVQHRFPEPGVYAVSLRVIALNPFQSLQASVNVTVYPATNNTTSSVGGMDRLVTFHAPGALEDDRESGWGNPGLLRILHLGETGSLIRHSFTTAISWPAWDVLAGYVLAFLR